MEEVEEEKILPDIKIKVLFVGDREKGQQGFAPLQYYFSNPDPASHENSLLFLDAFDSELISIEIVYYTEFTDIDSVDACIIEDGWEETSALLSRLKCFLPIVFVCFQKSLGENIGAFLIDLNHPNWIDAIQPLNKLIELIKQNPASALIRYVPGCNCSGFQCLCFSEY